MNTKKIVLLIIMLIIMSTGFVLANLTIETESNKPINTKYKYLREFDTYKKIDITKVKELEITRYTVGGDNPKTITDYDEIKSNYNNLGNMKIGKETDQVCEDNSTVYNFIEEEKAIHFEIECNWIIINNKRYLIYKN